MRSVSTKSRSALLVAVLVGVALGVFSLLADGIVGGRLFTILGNLAAPWGLAAFFVGYRATSSRQGALAGALALVVGVATYYLGGAIRDYVVAEANVVWTVVALVAGPIMGLSGAEVSSHRARPPIAAVAAPSAMLVAEALFLVIDRRPWNWDIGAETYRLIDLGVIAALLIGGLVLPWVYVNEPRRRGTTYLVVAATGACGALGFVLLQRLVATVV
ncbi:MAG: DUF6518 family protein [Actinobacteria bacterium]|nr:DUF6518 family protein [Actinomycetota bacterium]